MGVCDGVPVLGVLELLALLAALLTALALARAVRRGTGASAARPGLRGRLIDLAFPTMRFGLVVVEVILLWHVIADRQATSATPFGLIEDLLGCSSFARSDALLLSGWLLPHAVACALLLSALGHQMLAGLGRLAQKQGTREPDTLEAGEVGGQPQSSSSSFARAAEALRAAVADALASCTLMFLLAHVVVAQAAFRGLSCGMGVESQEGVWAEDQGCGNIKRWGPFTILAVLLNVVAPTFILAWIVFSAQKWPPVESGTGHADSRAAGGDSFVNVLRGQVVCFVAAFVPCQPWLPGQLVLDALMVAFAEIGMASGTEQGRQLGLACSQIVVFAEVLLLLWPRWLLNNDRLLRFNVTMRLSLLLASHLNEAAPVRATWPWPVAFAAAAIWAARWLLDRLADGRAAGALQAVACSLGLRPGGSKQPTVPFDPEVGLARDLSQGSLWAALSDPAQLGAICGGLSRDESACLSAAAGLAAARLRGARDEDLSTVSLHRQNSMELLSTSVTRDVLSRANLSSDSLTQNTSGSLDWVAPLPLLATDDESAAGRKRARDGQSEGTMLTKKWLLDHFVPASNGPDLMNDAMNRGAPAVSSIQSVEEIIAHPPRSYHSRSHCRFAVNSRSAEDLIKMPNAKASEIMSMSRSKGGLLSQSSTSGVPIFLPRRPEQQSSTPVPTFEFSMPGTSSELAQCDTAAYSSNPRSSEATSSQLTWDSEGQFLVNVSGHGSLGLRGGDQASSSSSRAEGLSEGHAKIFCFKNGTLFDSPEKGAFCEQSSSLQCSPRSLAPPPACPELRQGRSADSLSRDSRTSTAEVIGPFWSESAASAVSRGSRGGGSASSSDLREESKKSCHQADEDYEHHASEAWSPRSPSTPPTRGGRPDAWAARPPQLKFGEVPFPEPYRKLLAVAPPHSLLRTLSARCESLGHLPAVEEIILDDCMSQKSPSVFSRTASLAPTADRKQVLRARSGTSELASPVPTFEHLQVPTVDLMLLPEAEEQRGYWKAPDASGGSRARHTDDKGSASSRMRPVRVPSELSIASSRDTYDLLQSAIHMSQDHFADRYQMTLRKQMDALKAENARLRQESEDMKAKREEWRAVSVPSQVQAAEAEGGRETDAHPAVAVAAALEAAAAAVAAGKEEELGEADRPEAAATEEEKGQPSTRCTTASGAQTSASSGGSSADPAVDNSKEAQWQRWKARKEAKKAKADRTTYGQMLRNMTD